VTAAVADWTVAADVSQMFEDHLQVMVELDRLGIARPRATRP